MTALTKFLLNSPFITKLPACQKSKKCYTPAPKTYQNASNLRAPNPCPTKKRSKSLCKPSAKGNTLTLENMNQNITNIDFAIHGALEIRAHELQKELQEGVEKPFKELLYANVGDSQGMGQKPITFFRQVMAVCVKPELMCEDNLLPPDVIMRGREVLAAASGHSICSYTPSQGIELFRRDVACYIQHRDGHECDYTNVYLSNGATTAIKDVLGLFTRKMDRKKTGIMIPIPTYPLYSACCSEYDLVQCPYYLDEDNNWELNIKELERCHDEYSKKAIIRAIIAVNPGNPTGQVLTKQNIKSVLKFAYDRGLVVLADEVYQHNIYACDAKFHSFKKILKDDKSIANNVELASFMSTSKGYMGECGIRGGWCELTNFDPRVKAQLYKTGNVNNCSCSIGQLVAALVAKPPQEGDPSYPRFVEERDNVLNSMKDRAELVVQTFKSMKGFKCNNIKGAMYAFPQIMFPPKAIEAAKKENKPPDTFYLFKLLEKTGICLVAGNGFGQKPGTYHLRTTILPPIKVLQQAMVTLKNFHENFSKKYT